MQIKSITIALLFCTQVFAIPLSEEPAEEGGVQATSTEGKCHMGRKYFIPEVLVESELAADTCVQHGGILADITSVNFIEVVSLLIECKGSFSRGWIKTWENTDYGSTCLAMYAGQSVPGGGVDINCLGDTIAPVCIGPQVLPIDDTKPIDQNEETNDSVQINTPLVDPIPPTNDIDSDDDMLVSGSFMDEEQKMAEIYSIAPASQSHHDRASKSYSHASSITVLHPRKSKKEQK